MRNIRRRIACSTLVLLLGCSLGSDQRLFTVADAQQYGWLAGRWVADGEITIASLPDNRLRIFTEKDTLEALVVPVSGSLAIVQLRQSKNSGVVIVAVRLERDAIRILEVEAGHARAQLLQRHNIRIEGENLIPGQVGVARRLLAAAADAEARQMLKVAATYTRKSAAGVAPIASKASGSGITPITTREVLSSLSSVQLNVVPSVDALEIRTKDGWHAQVANELKRRGIPVNNNATARVDAFVNLIQLDYSDQKGQRWPLFTTYLEFAVVMPAVVVRAGGLRQVDAIVASATSIRGGIHGWGGRSVQLELDALAEEIKYVIDQLSTVNYQPELPFSDALANLTASRVVATPRERAFVGLNALTLNIRRLTSEATTSSLSDRALTERWEVALAPVGMKLVPQSNAQLRQNIYSRANFHAHSVLPDAMRHKSWTALVLRTMVIEPGVFLVNGTPRRTDVITWRLFSHDAALVDDAATAFRRLISSNIDVMARTAAAQHR